MRNTSLWIIVKDDKIFLWRKKTWMATGVFNGVWGKQEWEESIETCMIREAREEIGIDVLEKDLEKVGVMRFYFKNTPHYNNECHVFMIHDFSWEIIESDEIEPHWFELSDIPFQKMWEADKIWLWEVLQWSRNIEYTFYYDKDNGELSRQSEALD